MRSPLSHGSGGRAQGARSAFCWSRAWRLRSSGSLWLLVPAALLFAVVNAAVEEAAYRGVVLAALDETRITARAALVLQAAAFAALHFRAGFPRGAVGVGLTFVYGLVLGELRRRAGGLMVPFITHLLTDLVIVTIVLVLVRT